MFLSQWNSSASLKTVDYFPALENVYGHSLITCNLS